MQPRDFIYLDNAATSFPKPEPVAEALADFTRTLAVNPGRSGADLAARAAQAVDDLRTRLAHRFGLPGGDRRRVAFTANATDALNLALQGMLRPGDHVVATVLEHNSVLRPLHELHRRREVAFDLAPCGGDGRVDPDAVRRLLRPATRLVVMTAASNVTGVIQDVAAVGALCHERGIMLLVDAAQAAGHVPLDMAAAGIDLLALTGHKGLLGPTGIGALLVAPGVPIESTRWGGTGVRSAQLEHLAEFPHRLEAGTLNTTGLAGLRAALRWREQRGEQALRDRERELTWRLREGLDAIAGVTLHPAGVPAEATVPVVSFTLAGMSPEEAGIRLDVEWGIVCRTGLHCAPLAHAALGTAPEGTVRLSPGPFTTEAEIDTALEAIAALGSRIRR